MAKIKFSIVIPAYNVEKYIEKCLNSILNQNYSDFEVIIVNDGSTDNTENIIKKNIKKDRRFKLYNTKNKGVSSARNFALQYVNCDYLLFMDSDDYMEDGFLNKLNNFLYNKDYDLVRFSCNVVDDKNCILRKVDIREINNSKNECIVEILNNYIVDVMWLYAYKWEFFQKNEFKFVENKVHEDFGLLLPILKKTNTIAIFDCVGINYVQRENSIMSSVSYDKLKRKVEDFYYFYKEHKKMFSENETIDKILLNFSASCMIIKCRELNSNDLTLMLKKLKKDKISNDIYCNSLGRVLKKIFLTFFMRIYIVNKKNN